VGGCSRVSRAWAREAAQGVAQAAVPTAWPTAVPLGAAWGVQSAPRERLRSMAAVAGARGLPRPIGLHLPRSVGSDVR